MSKERVVVTGMGIVSCLGNDPEVVYERLLAGESGVSPITQFSIDGLDSKIGGMVIDFDPGEYIDKKQARRVDRSIAFALYAGKRALLSANIPLQQRSKEPYRAGVIIGSGVGGMGTFFENARTFLEKGPGRVSPFLIPFIITDMASALLAQDMGYMGPNYSISTACASSNYSIIAAASYIQNGEVDIMVCGGTEAGVTPIGVAGFCAMKALSCRNSDPQKASRPFDKGRDGFVMAEGCGVLVLESLTAAKRRHAPILAEYLGGAISCDAHHMTEPRPDGKGVALCVEKALVNAKRRPEDISYINAHATSTLVGDMTEIKALEQIFTSSEKIALNATKSMIGHALGAAGGIEAIATIQAIRTGYIHPTINLDDSEEITFHVPTSKERCDIACALSNSFGFGGHNATIVLAPYIE